MWDLSTSQKATAAFLVPSCRSGNLRIEVTFSGKGGHIFRPLTHKNGPNVQLFLDNIPYELRFLVMMEFPQSVEITK